MNCSNVLVQPLGFVVIEDKNPEVEVGTYTFGNDFYFSDDISEMDLLITSEFIIQEDYEALIESFDKNFDRVGAVK